MVTLDQVAEIVNGKVIGDEKTVVKGISCAAFAEKGDITFSLNTEDLEKAGKSPASCVLTTKEINGFPKALIKVDDIKTAMTILYNAMLEITPPAKGKIDKNAVVAKTASLGENVYLGPGVVIGDNTTIGSNTVIKANVVIGDNCSIGNNVIIHPNTSIYKEITIGNNVIIHAGTVIGSDGFGFLPKGDKIYKVPQLSGVIIEDNVEIGANVCIDRGAFTDTVIGRGTKIDNLVQIAHNCKLGKNVLVAGQSGIAGSTVIGDNTMMGGNVGISDHSVIGKNVRIAAKSAVKGKVSDGAAIWGYPAIDAKEFMKIHALLLLLSKKSKQLRDLLRNKT